MSISHKAYPFDQDAFSRELSAILYAALETDNVDPLRAFINANHASMTDDDREPLAAGWEPRPDEPNARRGVQVYADLALSRYLDRDDGVDWGLGRDFEALGRYFRSIPKLRQIEGALICGYLFGPRGRRLDLGMQATGLVSTVQTRQLLERLRSVEWPAVPGPDARMWKDVHYQPYSADKVVKARGQLIRLYEEAVASGRGLMFADFNDMGSERM